MDNDDVSQENGVTLGRGAPTSVELQNQLQKVFIELRSKRKEVRFLKEEVHGILLTLLWK